MRAAEDQCQFGERGLRSGFFKYGKRMQSIECVGVGEEAENGGGEGEGGVHGERRIGWKGGIERGAPRFAKRG